MRTTPISIRWRVMENLYAAWKAKLGTQKPRKVGECPCWKWCLCVNSFNSNRYELYLTLCVLCLLMQVNDRLDRYCCGFTPDPTELCVENLLHAKCGNTKNLLLVHILVRITNSTNVISTPQTVRWWWWWFLFSLCAVIKMIYVLKHYKAFGVRLMSYSQPKDKFAVLCFDWCVGKKNKENTFPPAMPNCCSV